MKRTLSAAAAACAALALTLPASAQAAPTAGAAPTGAGFAPVATYTFRSTPTQPGGGSSERPIASPTDGVAYVGGVDTKGVVRIQRAVRTKTGATMSAVALPAIVTTPDTQVRLAANGGRTYALVINLEGRKARLFSISGTKATELVVPAGPDGKPLVLSDIAVDGPTSLWLSGVATVLTRQMNAVATYHGNGKTWTLLPLGDDMTSVKGAYAVGGHFFQNFQGPTGRSSGSIEWTGSEWVRRENTGGFLYDAWATYNWTFASPTDFTRWGYSKTHRQDGSIDGPKGYCRNFRTDGGTAIPCVAPAWPVSAAVRLADGSVVLGGHDAPSTPGGFAVVPTPGAAPVAVAGDNGTFVEQLTAATTGRTVWAVTVNDGVSTLQVMSAPKAVVNPPCPPKAKGKGHCPPPHKPKRHPNPHPHHRGR